MDTTNFPLFSQVKADHDVTTYIGEQNKSMKALHFTEHSFAHVGGRRIFWRSWASTSTRWIWR